MADDLDDFELWVDCLEDEVSSDNVMSCSFLYVQYMFIQKV